MTLFANHRLTRFAVIAVLTGLFISRFFPDSLAQPAIKGGLKFNGSNFVDCGNPAGDLFDFNGEGTLEAWVKVTATPPPANSTTFFPIVARDEGPGETNKWIFGIQNGKLVFHVNSFDEDQGVPFSRFVTVYSESFDLALNKYYHFAMTKDKGNKITFYINGIAEGSSVLSHAAAIVNAPLLIGKAEPGFYLNGEVHELRFWKKALNADEIMGWMYRGVNSLHPQYGSLAAWLNFSAGKWMLTAGHEKRIAGLETDPVPVLKMPFLPPWLVVLIIVVLVAMVFGLILYRMRLKMNHEKMELELFAAQMNHENNNGIGMIINILSAQLNEQGLAHLDTQLKLRLQTITDLQSPEYITHGEKGLAFKKYITHLLDKMNASFNQGRQIIYEINLPEKIKAKYAMKLAVLIRELTLNSLKHAFNGRTDGAINISIIPARNGFYRFEFSDNGSGVVPETNVHPSIGTALINSVSSQLGGKPDIITDNGYKFVLLFR